MNLRSLKNNELELQLHQLVTRERKLLHVIILHIQEVERRKLYLEKSYSSLFDYLVKELGYSAPAAQRRVEATRLVTALPEAHEKIESGELNLSQIGDIQRAFKQAEKIHGEKISRTVKSEILQSVLKASTEDTQKICAQRLNIPIRDYERIQTQADSSRRIELTLSEEQFVKLQKIKGLIAPDNFKKGRSMEIADILETCFDLLLEESPVHSMTECKTEAEVNSSATTWKSLTVQRKKQILQRDRCCQYVNYKTGEVCESQFQLEVDHIQPLWAGGRNDLQNLRVLCRKHNQFRYHSKAWFDRRLSS